MQRLGLILALATVAACGSGKDDTSPTPSSGSATGSATGTATGTATGGTGTGTGSATTDVFDVSVVAPNQSCDPTGTTTSLTLTGDTGRASANHIGVTGDQCADWEITAVGTRSTMTIDVTYTDTNTVSCGTTTCAWSLSYILDGLEAGTWTVNADGASEQVVVDY